MNVHWKRTAPALMALAVIATSSFGDMRFQAIPFANGHRVKGATVCFFEGRQADDFSERFLASDEIRCSSADNALELPTGYWNYFVQQGDGWISSHPHGIQIGAAPQGSVKSMRVELLPAATLDLRAALPVLRPGEYFAVYLSNEGQPASRPSVRPIAAGAPLVVVPADMRILPLIVRDEAIVWSGRPLTLSPGAILQLPFPQRPGTDVAAVVTLDRNVPPQDRMAADGAKAPTVRLVAAGTSYPAAFPLRTAPVFDGSVLLFQDIPPGNYELELSGDYWLADHLLITVDAHRVDFPHVSRALVTRPLGHLEITWSLPSALAQSSSSADCDTPHASNSTKLTIKRCIFGFDRSTARDCVLEHEIALPDAALHGTESIPKLVAGDYYAALVHGGVETRVKVPVRPGQTTRANVFLNAAPIMGHVTRAAHAVRAQIQFTTGGTMSDADTGEYFAYVNGAPGYEPITVTPCDTRKPFIDIPPVPLKADSQYDIAIPSNQLNIQVLDATTQRPVPGARVTNQLLTAENTVPPRDVGITDTSGTVVDEGLSPIARFTVCARLTDYETNCEANIRLVEEKQSLTLTLRKSTARTVRLVSQNDLGFGKIFVVVDSRIIASANIEHHDQVRIEAATPPNAYLFLAAHNYPLRRFELPNLADEEPTIALPPVSGARLTITLPASSSHRGGPFTLALGGDPIPRQVLQYYQLIQNGDVLQIRSGETVTIGPIDATAPLTVLLWYWAKDAPIDARGTDPFENPAILQHMYRQPLSGTVTVLTP
jgi:hypothetical protein